MKLTLDLNVEEVLAVLRYINGQDRPVPPRPVFAPEAGRDQP